METNQRIDALEGQIKDMQGKLDSVLELMKSTLLKEPPAQPVVFPPLPAAAPPVTPVVLTPLAETPPPVTVDIPVALVNLLKSKEWPHAVDPILICDVTSEQDKEDRAEGILDLIIDVNLENLKFLDFGCGEGHVINRSKLQNPKMAVGYDIVESERWKNWELKNGLLTTNWEEVKSNGPYNVVLIYDVIDHMMEPQEQIINRFREIKKMLAPGGKVFVRTHPFCSRHGTHLYHQINKAFVHLVFTEEELLSMGYKQAKTRKIIHPIQEYSTIFNSAGFRVQSGPHHIKEGVENIFIKNPVISQRIKNNYANSLDVNLRKGTAFPTFQLEQQFIDYVLA